jgi:hypothetical protein
LVEGARLSFAWAHLADARFSTKARRVAASGALLADDGRPGFGVVAAHLRELIALVAFGDVAALDLEGIGIARGTRR